MEGRVGMVYHKRGHLKRRKNRTRVARTDQHRIIRHPFQEGGVHNAGVVSLYNHNNTRLDYIAHDSARDRDDIFQTYLGRGGGVRRNKIQGFLAGRVPSRGPDRVPV